MWRPPCGFGLKLFIKPNEKFAYCKWAIVKLTPISECIFSLHFLLLQTKGSFYFWKRGKTSTSWLGFLTMGMKAIPKCIYYKFRCWWFRERLLRERHKYVVFRDQHWIQRSELPICVHAGQRPPRRRIHPHVYSGHNLHRQQHESQEHFLLLR